MPACALWLLGMATISNAVASDRLRIVAPTTLVNSGVVTALVEDFSSLDPHTQIDIRSMGALQVLRLAERGEADLILSHYPRGESLFLNRGFGSRQAEIMYNDFAIIGPRDNGLDFARIGNLSDLLTQLSTGEVDFLAPHPDSGTYQRLQDLLLLFGLQSDWDGFVSSGTDVVGTLAVADDMELFTFADIGSYMLQRANLSGRIVPLYRDDVALQNRVVAIVVNPARFPEANVAAANRFWEYLVSERGQSLVRRFGAEDYGVRIFTPIAHLDPHVIAERRGRLLDERRSKDQYRNASIVLLLVVLALTAWLYLHQRGNNSRRRLSEQRFAMALDGTKEGIWDWHIGSKHGFISEQCQRILGASPRGEDVSDPMDWFSRHVPGEYWDDIQSVIAAHIENCNDEPFVRELRIERDGASIPIRVRARVMLGADSSPERVLGALADLHEEHSQRELIDHLAHLATHDSLTGLPNRRMLEQCLEQSVQLAHRTSRPLSLLLLDLDDFKRVNDTLGHHAGDTLLIKAANHLVSRRRETDLVARLGGDEFVILLEDTPAEIAKGIAEETRSALKEVRIPGWDQPLGVSIGVCELPTDGTEGKALLSSADRAMYHAKTQGQGRPVSRRVSELTDSPALAAD